jgi:hypothetical protein
VIGFMAMGLAAELRRLTGSWYARHHPGEHLWIDPPRVIRTRHVMRMDDDDDDGGEGVVGETEMMTMEDPDDGGDPGEDEESDQSRFGIPEFRDPYAFNDEDLLMSHPDVPHDMEIIEENLTDDGPVNDDEFPPDDPYWRRKNDPF